MMMLYVYGLKSLSIRRNNYNIKPKRSQEETQDDLHINIPSG